MKNSGFFKVSGWVLAFVLAGAAYYVWMVKSDPAAPPETKSGIPVQIGGGAGGNSAQSVRAAEVTASDVPIIIKALGTVTPLTTLNVQSQVSGQLQHIQFREGQLVKRGDFLAQIDDRPFQTTLAQAQAQQARDVALFNQAQADLTRYQTLMQQDSIARQQVDDQTFLVKQYQATVASDQAQIDAAKLNIMYCHITSPIDGRAGLRQVDEGNYIQTNSSTPLVVITQTDPISVIFAVPEDNIPAIMEQMATGAELSVSIFDRAAVTLKGIGKLAAIDSQIDVTTGTIKLRAVLDNKDGHLFAQEFVNARLLVKTLKDARVVPSAAIQQGVNGGFVYIVKDDNTVSVRNVITGAVDGERTTVLQGLKLGDKVVIDGTDRLKEGARVMLRGGSEGGTGKTAEPNIPPPISVTSGEGLPGGESVQPKKNWHKDANAPAQ